MRNVLAQCMRSFIHENMMIACCIFTEPLQFTSFFTYEINDYDLRCAAIFDHLKINLLASLKFICSQNDRPVSAAIGFYFAQCMDTTKKMVVQMTQIVR